MEKSARVLATKAQLAREQELTEVLWDAMLPFFSTLRNYHKNHKINIPTLGRLVGTKAFYGLDYVVLRKDNTLRGLGYKFILYHSAEPVVRWSGATIRWFFSAYQGGKPGPAPKLEYVRLSSLEPEDLGWFAPEVLLEEDIKQEGGARPGMTWQVWAYGIPAEVKVPDLSEYLVR